MAYPVYQSTGGIGTGTGFDVAVPYPSTVNADDILVVSLLDADNDTFDVPAGWTKFYEDSASGNLSTAFYWKRATGSETGTVTFTSVLNAGALVAGIMYRYSGCVKDGIPIEAELGVAVSQGSSQTPDWDGNALGTQRLAVAINVVEDNTINGFTANSFTEDSRLSTSVGSDAHFAAASYQLPSVTEPTACVWGTSANEYHGLVGFYLIPEGDVPVTLNTAEAYDFAEDTTPRLEFTPNAVSDLDNEVQIQIDSANTFDSVSGVVDSYSESNQDADFNVGTLSSDGTGQSFEGDGNTVYSAKFYIKKVGSPTGNLYARLRNHTGTYGSTGIPTDEIIISNAIDISTLTTSYVLTEFIFSTKYKTINGTSYFITIEYLGGDTSNYLDVGFDLSSPTHSGNRASSDASSENWFVGSGDLVFYVLYKDPLIQAVSSIPDAGFLNTVSGGDTHPFNDNEKLSYTVQGGDALDAPTGTDTYYWRARAINPTGINIWDEWSSTRSFVLTEGGGGATLVVQDSLHDHDVDNVVLTQKNTLVSVDTVHAHSTDAIALSQAYTLVVQDTVHTHTVDGDLVLIQGFTLVVQESNHSHTVDALALVQDNILAVFDTLHEHTTDAIALVQDNTVVVADTLHNHTVDNVDLAQSFTLVVQESNHSHTVDNIELVQSNVLVVVDTLHSHSVDNTVLTQKNVLVVVDTLHSHTVDGVTLTQSNVLSIADTLHAHSVDNVVITQNNTLVTEDVTHDHSVDNVSLNQKNVLVVADTLHVHLSEAVDITQSNTLSVEDTLHAHSVDNITLELAASFDLVMQDSLHSHSVDNVSVTQSNILVVVDTVHGHTADGVVVTQKNVLIVADTLHLHLVDNINLVEGEVLTIQGSLHAHTSDAVVLTQSNTLAINESLHAHIVENISLTQDNILIVADSSHSHSVDNINLVIGIILTVQDSLHNHTSDAIILTQKNVLVVNDSLHTHSVDATVLVQSNILISTDTLHLHSVDNITLVQRNVIVLSDTLHVHLVDAIVLSTLYNLNALEFPLDSDTISELNFDSKQLLELSNPTLVTNIKEISSATTLNFHINE